jgi:BirA family biotin operon repressor/biotin-[acetyl-CoA-carboxylase] ligase
MIAALALRETLLSSTALQAEIKWPNDLLLSGRKTAGILCEARSTGAKVDFAILGIGLNVNLPEGALPPALAATSLALELGHTVPRAPLLRTILRCLDLRYHKFKAGQSPLAEWAAALVTVGQRVQVACGDWAYVGLAEAVDETGALLLRLDDGQTLRAPAGDVHTLTP